MKRLAEKVAIITGSASGIGAASAKLFAREGAKVVVVTDKNVKGASEVVDSISEQGGEAIFVQADVSKEDDCRRMVEAAVSHYGRLDILFNNAGMTIPKFLHETSSEELERLMAVNLKAVFWACKYAIPHMKKQGGGAILTTASKAGLVAQAGSAGYCASKFAVIGLMQAVALEYAEDNIRANSLCPGIIQTPMYEFFVNSQSDPQASRCWHEQAQPLGRVGTAEECAYAALYLCSDEASFTTGVALLVDGGFTAR